MLGDLIYNLRKNRKISQEEFAEILNTSRQAVSKWERNESKPDIDKLIIIAKLFNISIDYLLGHEINYNEIDSFIDKLKECVLNNKFIIDIDDIKSWCSKFPNNFKLYVHSSDYLYVAYIYNQNEEFLELALTYMKKAVFLFTPEYNKIISLNDLHYGVSQIYFMQEKYDLAKEYIENNNVYGCEILLTKCEMYLKNYEIALKQASEIYLKSSSEIMNASIIQIMVLLKNKKLQEAFDLISWTISFIKSIMKNKDFINNVLCPFIYLKATCERLLNSSSEVSIEYLKNISATLPNNPVISEKDSIKYYFGDENPILLVDSNIENTFKEIIKQTSKHDIHYHVLIDIYKEIFGEKENG